MAYLNSEMDGVGGRGTGGEGGGGEGREDC